MPGFDIIKLVKILLIFYVLPFQKIVYSINFAGFKSFHEEWKRQRVFNYVSDHQLYRATILNTLFDLAVIGLECTLTLRNLFFNPGCKVYTVDKRLRMVIVILYLGD